MEYNICPICSKQTPFSPRYPNYVCKECRNKATDENNRLLKFYNISASGGFQAIYNDTGEIYDSHICYIDNRKCFANEARFGGIVILLFCNVPDAERYL